MSASAAVATAPAVSGNVVSLAEWRARRRPDERPDPDPGTARPVLRLVEPGERPAPFRLDVFLSRAALIMAEG